MALAITCKMQNAILTSHKRNETKIIYFEGYGVPFCQFESFPQSFPFRHMLISSSALVFALLLAHSKLGMTSAAAVPSKVVVIGGGIQGSSVAYFLSKLSRDAAAKVAVTVIEANSSVAPHASGKGGGFLARSWGDGGVTQDLHHASFDLHEQLAQEWGLKSYRKLPVLSVPAGRSPVRMQKGAESFMPNWLDGEAGRAGLMGDGSDTAQVHPREFTETAIEKSGCELILNSKAVGLVTREEEGGGKVVTGVKLEGGEIVDCDALCVAMGPWAPQVEEWFDTVNVPMEGIKSTSVVWGAREGSSTDGVALFCGEDPRYDTHIEVYPRNDGTVYCCGVGGSDYIPANQLAGGAFLTSGCDANPARVAAATKALHQISKSYRAETPNVQQACMRPCPPDALPIMGAVPGFGNAYMNCGHNCWGILWAPICGKTMAELIIQGGTQINISDFNVARFGLKEPKGGKGKDRGRKRGNENVGEQW